MFSSKKWELKTIFKDGVSNRITVFFNRKPSLCFLTSIGFLVCLRYLFFFVLDIGATLVLFCNKTGIATN